ncbi:hypothetical protein [Methylocella sp.]|uniref:phage major capsid protein n=1 Tax=Methylocella sp. TaxID=1978226 RepID=UPI0035B498DC
MKKYLISGDLELDRPVGGKVSLNIDQGYYFAFILDDIIEKQSDINNMSLWADDAAQQMKISIDTDVLQSLIGQANANNRGPAAGAISHNLNLGVSGAPLASVSRDPDVGEIEVIDIILRAGLALDEQNVPEQGRWIVMPTWMTTQIKRSELRQVYLSGDGVTMLRNGRLGMVDRFTLYASNLLPHGTVGGLADGEFAVYAGHSHALTFASQITKVETMRSERTFGDILRGLQVYGHKVLDGKALVEAIVTQAGA